MTLTTPGWWYGRGRPPAWRFALYPLSWIWAAATARRLARGRPVDPGAPVICIGNLTVGGVGKTPVAREIALRLQAHGKTPFILSRGHGGGAVEPTRVDPNHHSAADVGDEPLMLASSLPVIVARDRAAGAVSAVEAGADIVVMDDGHQNPSVKKALSVVIVDGETRHGEWPFGDGAVFPAGPMREPLATGLTRADAVVILLPPGVDNADSRLLALFVAKPVLVARLEAGAPPPEGPQLGFAGVGKPWKIERALKDAGCQLVGFESFPDHAPYDDDALLNLSNRAASLGAGLVTTEKDWARLPPDWRKRVRVWPVRARFKDEAALDALLSRQL